MQGRSGKLAEPTTLLLTTKLIEAADRTWSSSQGVHIGVEKIDNNGNMKYTSTGLKTPISPWNESGSSVENGMDEPYICLYTARSGGDIWQDCDTHSLVSVCEFSRLGMIMF